MPEPSSPSAQAVVKPGASFMLRHPAHLIALGFGSGLSPKAPGTMGTLWAWLTFAALQTWLTEDELMWLMPASLLLGWWACTVTAQHLGQADPGSVVWDEIAAFWLVLQLLGSSDFTWQLLSFALFRFYDGLKPGPVGWADRLYHQVDTASDSRGWAKRGWGIMLDDYVAAACTLVSVFAIRLLLPDLGGLIQG